MNKRRRLDREEWRDISEAFNSIKGYVHEIKMFFERIEEPEEGVSAQETVDSLLPSTRHDVTMLRRAVNAFVDIMATHDGDSDDDDGDSDDDDNDEVAANITSMVAHCGRIADVVAVASVLFDAKDLDAATTKLLEGVEAVLESGQTILTNAIACCTKRGIAVDSGTMRVADFVPLSTLDDGDSESDAESLDEEDREAIRQDLSFIVTDSDEDDERLALEDSDSYEYDEESSEAS